MLNTAWAVFATKLKDAQMPKFNLSAVETVSAYTIVEADTLEEAIKISETRNVVLDETGRGTEGNDEWVIDCADGAPQDIHLS